MMSIHPLYAEALATFDELQAQARDAGEPDPTAMYLATATQAARPSLRTVLLKAHGTDGFVFYTHTDGRKGLELTGNPFASLLFHWPRVKLGVQVRIEGAVEQVSAEEADAYFASRPRESQLGAWASQQSRTLSMREAFDEALASFEAKFAGREIPRPDDWTGFRVVPSAIEVWYAGEFRLHERFLYERHGTEWSKRMLYP